MFLSRRLNVLICHHAAVLLLLTPSCFARYELVGAPQWILATLGDHVVLPCQLEPAADLTGSTLEWARSDLSPRFVHLRRDGVELLVNQHPSYVGRTQLSQSGLKRGDISLRLSDVKLSDAGTYRCQVPPKAHAELRLNVGAAPHGVSITAGPGDSGASVLLRCQSAGWYPEPELLWLDAQGDPIPSGPTQTLRGPDGLYTVSSGASVEKRRGNTFTCRVRQSHTNQSRETQVTFQGEVLMDPWGSAVRLFMVLLVAGVCLALLVVSFCRQRLNRPGATEAETKAEETKPLVTRASAEEEKRVWDHLFQGLTESKEVLQKFKDQQVSEVEEVERRRCESEKKHEKLKDLFTVQKDKRMKALKLEHYELKEKLDHSKKSLKETEDKLEKIQKMIEAATRLKSRTETGEEPTREEPIEPERNQ